jgi:maltose alpha-D-glucosyltransferase/alpha-amylase
LGGYLEGERDSISYPADKSQASRLIELFSLERVLYEIRHELDVRPTWVSIPVKGILAFTEKFARKDDA